LTTQNPARRLFFRYLLFIAVPKTGSLAVEEKNYRVHKLFFLCQKPGFRPRFLREEEKIVIFGKTAIFFFFQL
jgi:hypothetical protein